MSGSIKRRSFVKLSVSYFGLSLLFSKQAFSQLTGLVNHSLKNFFLPTDLEFSNLKKTFNSFIKKPDPQAILQAASSQEVQDFLNNKSFLETPLLMRSGGHSYAGFSTGSGLVLDSRKLKNISYSSDSIHLGSGLTLKEAQDKLSEQGYTFPSGEFPGVGIGGYFLGGGHSRRSRLLGLGADCVKSLSVILASGEKLEKVSPDDHPDLFWALLGGGGGNFSYVESFEIEKIKSFKDYFFKFTYPASVANDNSEIFSFWEKAIKEDPDSTAVNITVYVNNGYISKLIVSGLMMNVSGELEDLNAEFGKTHWSHLSDFGPSKFESSLNHSNAMRSSNIKEMYFKGASHYADRDVGSEGFNHIKESIRAHTQQTNMYMGFYSMGGKIKSPQRSISYPHRSSSSMIDLFSNFKEDKSQHQLYRRNFNSLFKSIDPLFSGRSYVNYPDLDFADKGPQRYYGSSLERLVEIKKKYDPKNRFDYGPQALSRFV